MKLRFLWVGKTREADLARGIERYLRRIRRYADAEAEISPEGKGSADRPAGPAARREEQALLERLARRGRLLGLDPEGALFSSERFARALEKELIGGGGQVQFVVGGPAGLPRAVRDRMHRLVSLTPMTLTHEMARLLLVEQVYRALTILRGEPYHR